MRISLMTTLMASALALGTAANAQSSSSDPQAQPQTQPQTQQQGTPMGGQDQQAQGADVQVRQPPADVQVEQQPPEVIVKQPQPEVTINQPEPKVTVDQARPDVNIEQGKPNVSVSQQGEPEVRIQEQAATPDDEQRDQMNQERAQDAQMGAGSDQSAASSTSTTTSGGTQAAMSLEQLMDKEVYTTGGEQVGEVSDVLVDAQGQPQKVVIEHGGFLGIGQREVAMDMNEIQMQGDQVQISATKDELQQMPEWDDSQVASSGFTSQRVGADSQTGATPGATPGTTTGATGTTTPSTQPRTD